MLALALPDPHLDHAALFRALLPLASLLLVGGFWSAIVSAASPREMLLTIAKFVTIVALLGIGTVRSIGVHYILGVAGVILWPLGWAVASLVTADLLAYVADQSLLPVGDAFDTLLWSTRTFLTTMLIGIWILFTTFAA